MTTLRQITKPPAYYGVFFYCDKSWFAARLSQIECEGIPQVGSDYSIKWAVGKKPELAKVVMSGAHNDVKKFLDENSELTPEQLQQSERPATDATTRPTTNAATRPTKKTKTAKEKKKECRVLDTGSPKQPAQIADVQTIQTDDLREEMNEKLNTISNLIIRAVDASAETILEKIEAVNQRVGVINSRISTLEASVVEVRGIVDRQMCDTQISNIQDCLPPRVETPPPARQIFTTDNQDRVNESIPGRFQIPLDTLRMILKGSHGPGNFALHLTERLYPELFSVDCKRREFSYNGGGVGGKKALDPQRKDVLRQYVLYFFPEFRDRKQWQSVINSINEGLRRPVKEKRNPELPSTHLSHQDNGFFVFDELRAANEILNGQY